jgi:hypothetical protein
MRKPPNDTAVFLRDGLTSTFPSLTREGQGVGFSSKRLDAVLMTLRCVAGSLRSPSTPNPSLEREGL